MLEGSKQCFNTYLICLFQSIIQRSARAFFWNPSQKQTQQAYYRQVDNLTVHQGYPTK